MNEDLWKEPNQDFEEILEQEEIAAIKRDLNRKWWQAKERPSNLFDSAPILWASILVIWALVAWVPILMWML